MLPVFAKGVKFLSKCSYVFVPCNRGVAVQGTVNLWPFPSPSIQSLCLPATTMLPIYSTFTSDINSLPCFACASCQIGNMHVCECLWFADLWEQCETKILLMAMGFCVSSLSCPVLKKMRCEQMHGCVFPVC